MRVPAGAVLAGVLAVRVPRTSEPDAFCLVRCLPGGTWMGTCPDFEYRHRYCKHIRRVRSRLAELESR